jgi:hypothetical protein
MDEQFQDLVDECIQRMLAGESMRQVLASHPAEAEQLTSVLQASEVLVRVSTAAPGADARARSMQRMQHALEAAALRGTERTRDSAGGVVMGWLGAFKKRSVGFQAAAVAAGVIAFGVMGMGAAAATGNGPSGVRDFLGLKDSSIKVEFKGVLVSRDGDVWAIDVNGDVREVVVTGARFFDGKADGAGDDVSSDAFAIGSLVEVKGTLSLDNTILASTIRLEDGEDGGEATVTPGAEATPGSATPFATATVFGDDDDDNCDNSGSGSACDDDIDEDLNDDHAGDNSGPGNASDDATEEDNSGPGNGSDDAVGDDNSGPGDTGDDGTADDHSDSGSDDSVSDDFEHSGSDDSDSSGSVSGDSGDDHETSGSDDPSDD